MEDIKKLPVMEHFYTLQGEGKYAGQAAYFVRLGGCDVGCVWCDVKESWDAEAHAQYDINEIVSWAVEVDAPRVVITGGEPLMHQLDALTQLFHKKNIKTHIETSGTHPISGDWDWITFSPKKFKEPIPSILPKVNELKVIVFHKSDIKWAQNFVPQLPNDCLLYLQAEWDKREQMTPLIIEFIKNNTQWSLSLQTHKYINIP